MVIPESVWGCVPVCGGECHMEVPCTRGKGNKSVCM